MWGEGILDHRAAPAQNGPEKKKKIKKGKSLRKTSWGTWKRTGGGNNPPISRGTRVGSQSPR